MRPDLEHTETQPRRSELHIMQSELEHASRHILSWSLHSLVVSSLLSASYSFHHLLQALLPGSSCSPSMG